MFVRFILFFILGTFLINPIFGQKEYNASNNLKFKHFSTSDGLSQSSVIAIHQDNKGYIWIGTRDGLNKYDGTRFTSFRHNSDNPQSLSHSWITKIFEDDQNNIWVGTKNGLNKYNPNQNNFTVYKQNPNTNSISDNEIWDIEQLNNNTLVVSTNNGLTKINLFDNSFSFIHKKEGTINSLKDNKTRCLYYSNNSLLWICTIESIECFDSKNNTWTHYEYPKNTNKEAHINNTPVFHEDSNNLLWLGYNNGLAYFDVQSKTFVEFYLPSKQKAISSAVRTLCEDLNGNLWIGTYIGLCILNKERNQIQKYIHDENNPTSLSQNSIYKIIRDTEGDMWIGTWAGGLNYYDHSFDTFKQFYAGANKKMLNYKVVSSIIESTNGDLWIGTEGGGINYYNNTTGEFSYYTHNPKDKNSLSSNNVKSMICDSDGNFWIGTHDGGLNFLDISKKPYTFKKFKQTNTNNFSISDYRILSLFEDEQKNIWIGTLTTGLIHYNRSSNQFTRLNYSLKSIDVIVPSPIAHILYLGGSNGLEKINTKTKQIEKINYFSKEINEETPAINCIYQQTENILWIGTEGKGLYKYDIPTKTSSKFGISQGLPNEVIYGILSDENHNLWVSTTKGISRLNLTTLEIKNFDESDGLQGNEFNYGAYLKKENGDLMFGGANGLNYFNPNKIVENNFLPSVDIYDIKVNNHPFLKITDSVKKISLKYNQNDFTIDFTALSYSQSSKNQYAYKLEGFDPDWNYIGNKKEAKYTNIDKGNYLFKVKASNNDGLWNEKGDAIKLIVLPAPWQTWWAYLIYFILSCIIGYYIRSLMLTRIKEKNELKQEKLDKERIEEVNQMKLRLFTNISHDFRTPLTLIIGPLQRMIKEKTGTNSIQEQHKIMNRNANMLLDLINQLLDFRKSESGKLVLYASKSNLVSFTQNIKAAFNDLADSKNIEYLLESPKDSLEIWFDKIKMKKILFNLLSNAFKYNQDNAKITIKLASEKTSKNENRISLKVTNFGEVIPKENLAHIFDRFYRFDQEGIQSGTGIGLALTKSLVELHHGSITATSSVEKGTCFEVVLPMGSEHLSLEEQIAETDAPREEITIDKPFYLEKNANITSEIDEEIEEEFSDIPTILIVEDNEDVRNFVKDIFKKNYTIYEAENGKIAIEIARKKNIDLIISDVMMPEMNGFELCENIKSTITTSHIPIILLTAKTADTHQKTGFKIGADAYITKPFDASILELRVHNLLETRKNLTAKFKKDIILNPKELTVTSADELFLEKAIEIIEENITDPEFNVHYFTNQMNMSRSVLYRKLKALTNQSITEFIRTIKLKKAGQLVANTKMHISEIAYEVGFSDLKYFRKCFKSQFNELPSNYRIKNTPTDTDSSI
tara:strand:+ start:49078 stop:53193 length:4116 start_codon:yes stop_codon:yes gene_type:complete